jgi:hypothetical protein
MSFEDRVKKRLGFWLARPGAPDESRSGEGIARRLNEEAEAERQDRQKRRETARKPSPR